MRSKIQSIAILIAVLGCLQFQPTHSLETGITLSILNDKGPSDLTPNAQSYFIVPETPSTTTVRPTFTRRKTKRPISSLTEVKKKPAGIDKVSSQPEVDTSNYNPFKQIVDTGFQAKKQVQRKRPSAIEMMRRDQNANQGVTPVNHSNTNHNESKKEEGNANTNANAPKFGRRRPIKKANPDPETTPAPSKRPQRFAPQRRTNAARKTTDVPANESQNQGQSTPTQPSQTSGRRGRQFGRSKVTIEVSNDVTPKAVEVQPAQQVVSNKSHRRRKKFTTTTISTIEGNELSGNNGNGSGSTDPELRRINANVFANRRPLSLSKTALNPVENAQVALDSTTPLTRKMRGHRFSPVGFQFQPRRSPLVQSPAPAPVAEALISEPQQESSDTVTILADGLEETNNGNATSANEESPKPQPQLPVSPRNLSNRRPNPLDRLSNRQAAGRRFLTPKKTEPKTEETQSENGDVPAAPSTTKAPPASTTTRVPRKSPLSLANLRNRRLGGSTTTTTTTTTEAPAENQEVLGNLEQSGVNGTEFTLEVPKDGTNGTAEASSDVEGTEQKPEEAEKPAEEEPKPGLPGLLRNRRPPLKRPLPGQRPVPSVPSVSVPIKSRASLKPKTTEPTTEKPTAETTTPPSCEEGKRYNKILRKCIPGFSPKSG